jgi:chromosome segregation ATPase
VSDNNNSHDIILAKLEERFTQLLDIVNSIKNSLDNQTTKISELDRKIITLEIESTQRQRDIDSLKAKNEANRKWLMGIAATIIGGVILAGVKFFIGL